MFSSATDNWETPQAFFDELNKEFGFRLDVCASNENTKCSEFFDVEADGLEQKWLDKACWMNPPYGRTIGQWMKKAYDSAQEGATVVCLVPSRTDTKWWRCLSSVRKESYTQRNRNHKGIRWQLTNSVQQIKQNKQHLKMMRTT
jgi:phage N-6-adenine-methyltransferase